eukprot:gene19708-26399_t
MYNSICETTDEAITSARTVNGTVYQIAQYIAAFNNAMVFPELGRSGGIPEGLDLSHVNHLNIHDLNVFKRSNAQLWKPIVTLYKILKGTSYVCSDAEFNNLFDQIKSAPAIETITAAGIFQGLIRAIPVANKLPPTTVSIQMDMPVVASTLITSNDTLNELANDDAPAFTICAVQTRDPVTNVPKTKYVAKMKLNGICKDCIVHVGTQTMIHNDPYQYVMFAALMGQLEGSTFVVDATQAQMIGSSPSVGVTMVQNDWYDGKSPFFGFKINAVLGAEITCSTLSLKLEVSDLPVGNSVARLDNATIDPLADDETIRSDVVVASSDVKLGIKFVMQLSGLTKN